MPEITIYTKPGCPYCAAAKRHFDQKGFSYKEVNTAGDPAALREMLGLNGGRRRVPTIVEDGSVTVGFEGGG